jgi:hypothetical protein
MDSMDADYEYIGKQLSEVLKKCMKKNIEPEVVIEVVLSFAGSLAVTSVGREDAAELLESLAEAIRSGEIEVPED